MDTLSGNFTVNNQTAAHMIILSMFTTLKQNDCKIEKCQNILHDLDQVEKWLANSFKNTTNLNQTTPITQKSLPDDHDVSKLQKQNRKLHDLLNKCDKTYKTVNNVCRNYTEWASQTIGELKHINEYLQTSCLPILQDNTSETLQEQVKELKEKLQREQQHSKALEKKLKELKQSSTHSGSKMAPDIMSMKAAVENCNADAVKRALQNGHSIYIEDSKEGNSIIHLASITGCAPIIDALVHNFQTANIRNKYGSTPLISAAEFGQNDIVKLLLQRGAEIEALTVNDETALHAASFGGHVPVVHDLLYMHANKNARASNGRTALHYAAMKGHLGVAELLIMRGVDPTVRNLWGFTAGDEAMLNGFSDVAQYLNTALQRFVYRFLG